MERKRKRKIDCNVTVCFQETKHGPFTSMSHAVGAGLDTLKVDPEVAASPGPGPLASIELKPIVSSEQ